MRQSFRRSVTQKPDIEAIDQMLSQNKNIWRDLFPGWHLTDTRALWDRRSSQRRAAEEATAGKPRASRRGSEAPRSEIRDYRRASRDSPLSEEITTPRARGSTNWRMIAAALKFLDAPPLTLDDQLEYKEPKLRGRRPSRFVVVRQHDQRDRRARAAPRQLSRKTIWRWSHCCPRC